MHGEAAVLRVVEPQQGLQHGLGREHARRAASSMASMPKTATSSTFASRSMRAPKLVGQLDEVRHHRGEIDRAAGDRRSERGAEDGDQPLLQRIDRPPDAVGDGEPSSAPSASSGVWASPPPDQVVLGQLVAQRVAVDADPRRA